jgi:hypothetical protein
MVTWDQVLNVGGSLKAIDVSNQDMNWASGRLTVMPYAIWVQRVANLFTVLRKLHLVVLPLLLGDVVVGSL